MIQFHKESLSGIDNVHLFLCPRLIATEAELKGMGITVAVPKGHVLYRVVDSVRIAAEIGMVTIGRRGITAIPRIGASRSQMALLAGAAESTLWTPPRKADGWRYGGGLWRCWISGFLANDDPIATAIRSSVALDSR